MNRHLTLFLCGFLFSSPLYALEGDGGAIETGDYTTTAISAAGSIGATTISIKKYKSANVLREGARKFILKPTVGRSAQALTENNIRILNDQINEGDEIRFMYHRGPEANKQLHLDRILSDIESAESSASFNRHMAIQAMLETKQVQVGTDSNNRPIYNTVPDPKPWKALMYNNAATEDDARASRLKIDYTMKRGEPAHKFPIIELKKVISTSDEGVDAAKNFLRNITDEGGKFYQSSEIPGKVVAEAKKIRLKGLLHGVGGVVGAGMALEEAFFGAASNLISGNNDDDRRASSKWESIEEDNTHTYTNSDGSTSVFK